ncbi:DnaB-like helicase N-terminal domain-containing protein [Kitasatospora sp. P5_F3]
MGRLTPLTTRPATPAARAPPRRSGTPTLGRRGQSQTGQSAQQRAERDPRFEPGPRLSRALIDLVEIVNPLSFHRPADELIYVAILELYAAEQPVDLHGLVRKVRSTAQAEAHARTSR